MSRRRTIRHFRYGAGLLVALSGTPGAVLVTGIAARVFPSVGFAENAPPAAAGGTEKPAAADEKPYEYKGGRDPFIPLSGPGGVVFESARGKEKEGETEFAPGSLDLTGILKTKTGRWALLRNSGGGTYLVKDGKIQDPKRKMVQGYVGIVKEKSLVIIGPNNQVTELKLKKEQEAKKP